MDETRVAHDDATDIDSEIAVSAHEIRGREDKDAGREDKDWIEARVVNLNLINDPDERITEDETDESADGELLNQLKKSVKIIGLSTLADKAYESDGEHIGHWVIGAALELKHGAEVILEVQALTAQDREDGSGVSRRHCGGQQKRGGQAERDSAKSRDIENRVDENARQNSSKDDAKSGENHAWAKHRLYFRHLSVEAAREKNYTEGHCANGLRNGEVGELDSEAIGAADHSDAEEEEEQRDAELIPSFTGQDTQEKENRDTKENCFDRHNPLEIKQMRQ